MASPHVSWTLAECAHGGSSALKPDGEQWEKVMERVTAVRRFEVASTYSPEVCERCTNDANSVCLVCA